MFISDIFNVLDTVTGAKGARDLGNSGLKNMVNSGIDWYYKQQEMEKQYGYDKALKEQQYGYDTKLAEQQYGYDTALSAQGAQQELAKQVNQQDWEKMMSDTEMQRKIADYKAAGVNPALAMGGVSNTNATSSAQQASAPPAQEPKTNAKESRKDQNAAIMASLTTAIQAAIVKEAAKSLTTKAKALAKQPKNKTLQNSMKQDLHNYYNLVRM